MRLHEFILANMEPILREWETFAHQIWPGGTESDPLVLRNDAEQILRTAVKDMCAPQSADEQSDKSRGRGGDGQASRQLDEASSLHAISRMRSGFDLRALLAEYRALRANVVRLWRASHPRPHITDLDDLTRFHEAIDQSLTRSVTSYTQRVERSRQLFLAILGHDLRNPLNAIVLSADVVAHECADSPDAVEMAGQIRNSGEAMGRMIADLLIFAAATLGAPMPIAPAEMDLGALCRQVIDELRRAHPGRTLRFTADAATAVGQWDSERLRQALGNLLGNALQHGADPVEVSLSAVDPERVELIIRNGGAPIPPELLPRLFDPLFRVENPARARRPGSLGLGLYIAREIITAHGGTIDLTSTPTTGTLVTVNLPRGPKSQ